MFFNATRVIAKTFDERGLHFSLEEASLTSCEISVLHCNIRIPCGPTVMCSFISDSNDSDVMVRIYGILNEVPYAKRRKVKDACNRLSRKCRYARFYMDIAGDVHAEYDLLPSKSDKYVADTCFDIYMILATTLCKHYGMLSNAMYSEDKKEPHTTPSFINRLKEVFRLRRKPIVLDEDDRLAVTSSHLYTDLSNWPELLHQRIQEELEKSEDDESGDSAY